MSQHRFQFKDRHVLTGFDRPLQRYFLVVETTAQQSGRDDEYLYSNLNDESLPMGAMTVVQVMDKLAELKIKLPAVLEAALVLDGYANAGNNEVNYGVVKE